MKKEKKGFLKSIYDRLIGKKAPLDQITFRFLAMALVTCMGLAGIDQGLLILMETLSVPAIIQAHIGFLYWVIAALLLTVFFRMQVRKHYEDPSRRISDAAARISRGDFSVRIPPVHEKPEEQDFFDQTIADINTMAEELGSIETLKTDFISNVSHEMKTPLAVIRNYAELLGKGNIDEETTREYLAIIRENAGKMADLITNILRLNRIENQKIVPELADVDVAGQLCDCMLQFEPTWEKKNIEIDMDVEDSCILTSDEGLLEHVWMNLLSNAFKFTEPGGTVSVKEFSDKHQVTVEITDSGCGMDETTIRHIFDQFYQGDGSHATEGNGLGLALVQRILRLLHGEISVRSTPGEGSTFTVILPKQE